MTSLRRPPGVARRLPIPVPPALNETAESYLRRLAAINYLSLDDLRDHLGIKPGLVQLRLHPHHVARLVAITGYPLPQLVRALPQLSSTRADLAVHLNSPRPACPHCTRRHRGGRVFRYYPSNVHICPKHKIWVTGTIEHHQLIVDIGHIPAITAAHTRHRRAAAASATHGILHAFNVAHSIWDKLPDHPATAACDQRLAQLGLDPSGRVSIDDARYLAASYPNVVDIAVVLASPQWQRIGPSKRKLTRFLRKLGGRIVGEGGIYWPYYNGDPLAKWVNELTSTRIDWERLRPPAHLHLIRCHDRFRRPPGEPSTKLISIS
ncbi:TniQ family protein [Nocardia sp. NPDC055029]